MTLPSLNAASRGISSHQRTETFRERSSIKHCLIRGATVLLLLALCRPYYQSIYNPVDTIRSRLSTAKDSTVSAWQQAAASRQPIVNLLHRAGLDDMLLHNLTLIKSLPTWSQVTDLYGDQPVLLGKETCEAFRQAIPPDRRYVGVAGQMNTGTNALTRYLQQNLVLEKNPVHQGVLWTVPWYKHAWASLRHQYMYRLPDAHQNVLPVIIIRDPYFWMKSMCESPYTMHWNRTAKHCPNLIEASTILDTSVDESTTDVPADLGVPVYIRWNRFERQWKSLAHVWTSWYWEYYQADFPRLMVRFEDLLFHTETVLDEIRTCVGASWKNDEFVYQTSPAKTAEYFKKYKKQTGLVSALIKYGKDTGRRTGNMTEDDLDYAQRFVGSKLMNLFHYHTPAR